MKVKLGPSRLVACLVELKESKSKHVVRSLKPTFVIPKNAELACAVEHFLRDGATPSLAPAWLSQSQQLANTKLCRLFPLQQNPNGFLEADPGQIA